MDWNKLVEIVGAVCGSTAGAAVISFIAFLIKDAIVKKVDAKKSKLLTSDKREIAEEVKAAIKNGVEVDITSELDKATKKLVSEFKDTLNEIIKKDNKQDELLVSMAQVLANLKSMRDTQVIAELKKAVDGYDIVAIDEVDNGRVVAKVEIEEKQAEKEVSKIKY